MSILLWITIEMEYKIKCLKTFLLFTSGHQNSTLKGLSKKVSSFFVVFVVVFVISGSFAII